MGKERCIKIKNLVLNPNKKFVSNLLRKIIDNGNYCPCQLISNEDSKCPFDEYYHPEKLKGTKMLCINAEKLGSCICKLYVEDGD